MIQFIKDEFKRLQQKLLQKQKEVVEVETELHKLHCHPELAMKEKIMSLINSHASLHAAVQSPYTCSTLYDYDKCDNKFNEIAEHIDQLINYLRKSK